MQFTISGAELHCVKTPILATVRAVQLVAEEIPGITQADVFHSLKGFYVRCTRGQRKGHVLARAESLGGLLERLQS